MGVDLVGSGKKIVALVELEKGSKEDVKSVAMEIVRHNKSVKSVLRRVHGVRGEFRLREHRLVWGDEDTEVLHREHGYVIKVDPRLVYFSPRESEIRRYIARQVKPNERVLVMFAGAGPYAVCIAKAQPKVGEVVAIELNPRAAHYMMENVRMNKIAHLVTPIEGDVRSVLRDSKKEFDRVIMPMRDAMDFLDLAAKVGKKGCIIQTYMISDERELYKDCESFIKSEMKKMKRGFSFAGERKIALYAPGRWKVLISVKLK